MEIAKKISRKQSSFFEEAKFAYSLSSETCNAQGTEDIFFFCICLIEQARFHF